MTILQLRRYQKKDADLDAVAASGLAGPWTVYTPTVTAGTGAFGSASATGRYLIVGKLVFVRIDISIVTVGTAGASVKASLPGSATAAFSAIWAGREYQLTGTMLQGVVNPTTVELWTYNAGFPGGVAGYKLLTSGFYEAV